MSYFEIEDGIPPPPPRAKHPAKALMPGQSIVVPAHKDMMYARFLIRQRGYACTSRKLDDGSGIRVWCIDLNEDQGD